MLLGNRKLEVALAIASVVLILGNDKLVISGAESGVEGKTKSLAGLFSEISRQQVLPPNTSSIYYHVHATAIHVDRSEFPLTKLLFRLTLKLALESVKKRLEGRGIKLSLRVRSANTCSHQYAGAIAAEEYYTEKTRLFIVSGCDDAIRGVSRLASGWRVPVMTAAGFGADLDNKSVYTTLIRVAFSMRTAVDFLVKVLKSFQWRRANLIVDESDANNLALKGSIEKHIADAQTDDFRLNLNLISFDLQTLANVGTDASNSSSQGNTSHRSVIDEDNWPNKITDNAVREALRQSSLFSRVNILLVSQHQLRKFMLTVHDMNMANGLYTFINIPLLLVANEEQSDNQSGQTSTLQARQTYSASTGEDNFVWRSSLSPRNAQAKQAFESLMSIFLRSPTSKAYVYFSSKLSALANSNLSSGHLNSSYQDSNQLQTAKIQLNVNPYSASFYDCLQIYSLVLEESFSKLRKGNKGDLWRATTSNDLHANISGQLRNRVFENMVTGTIILNEKGDREADYTLNDLNQLTGKFAPVILYRGDTKELERQARIQWSSDLSVGQTTDDIECQLTGTCRSKPIPKFIATLFLLATPLGLTLSSILYFVYKRISLESQLVDYWWKISYKDIEIISTRRKNVGDGSSVANETGSQISANQPVLQQEAGESVSDIPDKRRDSSQIGHSSELGKTTITRVTDTSAFASSAADVCYGSISLGVYKLAKVALRPFSKFHQSRKLMIELRTIKGINHNNLCRFVGIVVDESHPALVTEFCHKGSLREFFQNESMVIDWTFKFSIINDIIAGLSYLHSSPLEFHGRLKSSNCLVSSRFVVKLSDYGLHSLHEQLDDDDDDITLLKKQIWMAPEHLKSGNKNGSKKGDVYSFGLLLYEIITNSLPFYDVEKNDYTMPLKLLYFELKANGPSEKTGPDLSKIDTTEGNVGQLVELVKQCLHFDVGKRSSLLVLQAALKKITRGVTSKKLLENLTSRMEQYTNNLESLVDAKLVTLLEEKLKTEELLYQFVPKSIASLLKEGRSVEPEAFECVTVFYSDIVGFTSLSSESSPIEVIDFLSDLYLCFDETLEQYDIFKVDTIGDAYIVASGLPQRNEGKHVIEIACAALELRDRLASFKIPHKPERGLQMRVGIHSGPCVAGIVGGLNMPKYCVFGDTLSIGKFMESSGQPMKIHITEESKALLGTVGNFKIEPRLPKVVKDGLPIQTYWLERNPD